MSDKPSGQSIIFRRSYQLRPNRVLLLEIGLWLLIAVFGLYDHIVGLVPENIGWVYIVGGLMMIPTILSQIELRSWLGYNGGSYRLIQAVDRPVLTFLTGWITLFGWAALGAFMARLFAGYLGDLLSFFTPFVIHEMILAAGIVLIFVVANVVGYRPAWGVAVRVIGAVIAAILIMTALLLGGAAAPPEIRTSGINQFFPAVALAFAAMWGIELTSELHNRRRSPRRFLGGSLGGVIIGGMLGFVAIGAGLWTMGLRDIVEAIDPLGLPIYAGFGVLVMAIGWQVLGLLMLRQFHSIGRDSIFSGIWMKNTKRFKTPARLILIQGLLAFLAIFIASPLDLAYMAALAFLLLQLGVNIAAFSLANDPRAVNRKVTLPLYPVIPASGAGISLLLIVAIPVWPPLVFGAIWLAVGVLFYAQVGRHRVRSSKKGVTVFQDTIRRPDIDTAYPVLVPIANPDTAMGLVAFGAEVARQHGGHLIILQVIQISDHRSFESGRSEAVNRLNLLEEVLAEAEKFDVPVEGITRIARNVAQGIVDTLNEESVKLCVMGWHARPSNPGQRGLGHIIDEVLDNATCDVVIYKGDEIPHFNRILVPASTGPHAPRAAGFALSLTAGSQGEVTLLNIARTSDGEEGIVRGREVIRNIQSTFEQGQDRIALSVVMADNPLEGILNAAEDQDVILLGVSEPRFLEQAVSLDLPIKIANETDIPVVLVRSYSGLTNMVARKAWQSVSDILPSLDAGEQMEVYRRMRKSARPGVNYFVLIILSALIATLGLLLDSPAVIIGAMLVAPLMSPIVAAATGMVFGDADILKNAFTAMIQGVVAAIFIAVVATLLTPIAQATPEILSRTQPTLLDLMVAIFSGAAGAYALARKEVGEALPGVAIAAALMPPVCVVGIGFALGDVGIAFGALLLFVANLVAIIFSAGMVFLLLGMRPPRSPDRQRQLRRGLLISVVSLLIVSIPLGLLLMRAVQQDKTENAALEVIHETTDSWGDATLVEFNIDHGWQSVSISGTVYTNEEITDEDIDLLSDALDDSLRLDVTFRLFVIEGTFLDSESVP